MILFVITCALLMIAMLVGIAVTATQNQELKAENKSLHLRCGRIERELNRVKLAHAYDKEIYDMDMNSMSSEVSLLNKEISKMDDAIRSKNKDIIKLKKDIIKLKTERSGEVEC